MDGDDVFPLTAVRTELENALAWLLTILTMIGCGFCLQSAAAEHCLAEPLPLYHACRAKHLCLKDSTEETTVRGKPA